MQKKITLLILCALFVAWHPTAGFTKMRPIKKLRAGVPPFQVIQEILNSNQKFAIGQTEQPAPRTPYMTWLADTDARIHSKHLLDNAENKIYSIRNFGSQLALDTGAIDYGVRYLYTPILLITSSTENQAIRFFMEGYAHLEPSIRRELNHLHLAFTTGKNDDTDAGKTFDEKLLDNIEKNIDFQVEQALERYKDRVVSGRLVVVGSILDLTNQYGHGPQRLIIINVNGERNDTKLKGLRHMMRLDKQLLSVVGRKRPSPKGGKSGGIAK